MLNKVLVGACVALLLAGCASRPSKPVARNAAAKPSLGCVSDTATRLPVKPNQCSGVGSTYTKQDLDRTGQPLLNDSLRMLSPAIR